MHGPTKPPMASIQHECIGEIGVIAGSLGGIA